MLSVELAIILVWMFALPRLLGQELLEPPPSVVAIGEGTAMALAECGWRVTAMPSAATAEVLAQEGEQADAEGHREQEQAGLGGRGALDDLQVQREGGQATEHRDTDEHRGDRGDPHRLVGEHLQREDRLLLHPPLLPEEADRAQDAFYGPDGAAERERTHGALARAGAHGLEEGGLAFGPGERLETLRLAASRARPW